MIRNDILRITITSMDQVQTSRFNMDAAEADGFSHAEFVTEFVTGAQGIAEEAQFPFTQVVKVHVEIENSPFFDGGDP